jgi:hypothetical protein
MLGLCRSFEESVGPSTLISATHCFVLLGYMVDISLEFSYLPVIERYISTVI